MRKIRIIISDAAVELAPKSWLGDRAVADYQKKYSRMPLIDATDHQHLLKNIPREQRNDRPDILHSGLLVGLGFATLISEIELYFSCKYGFYRVETDTRLNRSQKRFYGVLETLFTGEKSSEKIYRIDTDISGFEGPKVYFSRRGGTISSDIFHCNTFVFGGFATGFFRHEISSNDKVVSLGKQRLDLMTSLSYFLSLFTAHRQGHSLFN